MDFSWLIPYIPQIITAVASLGGVLIGLLINGRRESKRFDRQLAFEREKLLAQERRLLFIKVAHELQRMREKLRYRPQAFKENQEESWAESVTSTADKLFVLQTELRILSPELVNDVKSATANARKIRDLPFTTGTDEYKSILSDFQGDTESSMEGMRQALGTAPSQSLARRSER